MQLKQFYKALLLFYTFCLRNDLLRVHL